MPDFITEFRFSDSALPYDPTFTPAVMSPYHYAAEIRPEVAIYGVSGWMDGAAYCNGSISRYCKLSGKNPSHLLIGPWDHGARINVSPWRRRSEEHTSTLQSLIRTSYAVFGLKITTSPMTTAM